MCHKDNKNYSEEFIKNYTDNKMEQDFMRKFFELASNPENTHIKGEDGIWRREIMPNLIFHKIGEQDSSVLKAQAFNEIHRLIELLLEAYIDIDTAETHNRIRDITINNIINIIHAYNESISQK